ncbi:hypothetical protein N1028_14755 [Herbiconiux sp. CPCC 203407]|uniref:Uncharacterized protein n=1 Tax=Herbiconiux oxytropis TaxID=2970915 RepID=A0AA41XJD5_9MICO|nr:hypothetical protein [Herbiconiux oxytropis]MCS5722204.1 hypothetical protein [Herbiconiux oxytropis]MCS5727158.1 hypothetical protein [Herbiconiux oxytropis]
MPRNTSPERADLVFLRRRVKPRAVVAEPVAASAVPPAPAAAPAPSVPASTGLDLGGSRSAAAAPAPASRPAPSVGLDLGGGSGAAAPTASSASSSAASVPTRPRGPQPFPAPTAHDVRELGPDDPVLRLDTRQSAIGSLIVSGATAAAWESTDLVTGSLTLDGAAQGTPVVTPGNRPLVGFDEGDAIVALRHVRSLRRALFVGSGAPLGVQLFDDESFTVHPGDPAHPVVLSLLRIDGVLELRAEPLEEPLPLEAVLRQFGFVPTTSVAPRRSRTI